MTAWADRQVRLGPGANIKIGGSVKFNVTESDDAPAVFKKTLEKVIGIMDDFADKIENAATLPETTTPKET